LPVAARPAVPDGLAGGVLDGAGQGDPRLGQAGAGRVQVDGSVPGRVSRQAEDCLGEEGDRGDELPGGRVALGCGA
jgi:hypothetical protein